MLSVLFTDADGEIRELYAMLLTACGYLVETAGDGLECLAKLRSRRFDVLILDLELPWGGGDGVLEVMRADPRLDPVRVVLTSAAATRSELDDLSTSLSARPLPKPFRFTSLIDESTPSVLCN